MKRLIWIIIIICVIVGAYFGYKKFFAADTAAEKSSEIAKVEVKRGTIQVVLEETGEIQPIKEIKIKSKVSGEVLKLLVEEGDMVNSGDVIAQIKPDFDQADDIARKKDNQEIAEIRRKRAQKEYTDKKALYAKGLVPKDELDKAKDELDKAKIDHDSSVEQYKRIKDIEIDEVSNVSRVYATASGTVIQRSVEEGEMVSSSTKAYSEGTVLMTLADLKNLVVRAAINEVDISKIVKNQAVKINVDAYPKQFFQGTITKIAAKAEDRNNLKVFPFEILIEGADNILKPGMTANITISGKRHTDILVAPISAIFSNAQGQDVVYKVLGDSLSAPIVIETGINDFNNVEIMSGVAEGDYLSLTKNTTQRKGRHRKRQH